jgi:arginine/ornithine N-succinyltransferase beta subunit
MKHEEKENSQVVDVAASVLAVESQSPAPVVPVFNPVALLTDEQRKVLGARFNKTWVTPRMGRVEQLQKQYGVDYFTAAFTLAMLEDADGLISSRKIAKTADTMYNLSSELFSSEENVKAALLQIQTAFENLDVIYQSTAGKRFRQLVQKNFTSKMGVRILELVCEKLDVREAEWV